MIGDMEDRINPDTMNDVFYPKDHTLKILCWRTGSSMTLWMYLIDQGLTKHLKVEPADFEKCRKSCNLLKKLGNLLKNLEKIVNFLKKLENPLKNLEN